MCEGVWSEEMEVHLGDRCQLIEPGVMMASGGEHTISLSSIRSMASLSSTVGLFRENSSVLSE